MLDQTTKRKLDSARQILVGKVPDPKAQVEQITTALIYKFMDDMDKENEEVGLKTQFFVDDWKKFSWTKILDNKLSGQDRLDLYVQAITNMPKNPHIPQLFRNIFKGAFLPYNDPRTLSLFLKEINEFNYEHSENLGNAFEYLLSILGSQGDAGQFRTPRHIIDFIVEVVDPKKDETILDPACGTAGFLISAYKHILKQNKEKTLTPDEKLKLMNNLAGYDISPDMVKLALVNMYLHGFPEPKIHEYDSLTSEKRWDETFDVILANPPFQTKGKVFPHSKFTIDSNTPAVLFTEYALGHLSHNGRIGIIVPEGIVFRSDSAYKKLRQMILDYGLFAVVSLPSGVFKPYSGVTTSILFIDRSLSKNKDILFVNIQKDGFELGDKRTSLCNGCATNDKPELCLKHSDIPKALNIFSKWDKTQEIIESNFAHLVKKIEILSHPELALTSGHYRKISKNNSKYTKINLGVACDIKIGGTPRRNMPEYFGGSNVWVSIRDMDQKIISDTKEHITDAGVKKSNVKLIKKSTVLVSFKLSIGKVSMANVDLYTNEAIAGLEIKKEYQEALLNDYLFIALSYFDWSSVHSKKAVKGKTLNKQSLSALELPIPSIEVQKEIIGKVNIEQKKIAEMKAKIEESEINIKEIIFEIL